MLVQQKAKGLIVVLSRYQCRMLLPECEQAGWSFQLIKHIIHNLITLVSTQLNVVMKAVYN